MVNLAIVGLGAWGRKLVTATKDSQKARFTHAVVRRADAAREFADAHGLTVSEDYAAALADPAVEGVVSCGPAHLHAEHSLQALRAGKPVLAIKPMALAGAEARALRDEAQTRGVALALAYNRRFTANVQALLAEVKAGAIGDVLHTEGDFCVHRYHKIREGGWKGDPQSSPPGGLADHVLYLTIETLGRIADVHAVARFDASENRLADSTAVLARAHSGATAFLTGIGVTADDFRFQVYGSRGWAEARGATRFRLETIDGRKVDETLSKAEAERLEVEAFADAVAGRAPFPVSVEEAVHGVEALEAIARSANERRIVAVG